MGDDPKRNLAESVDRWRESYGVKCLQLFIAVSCTPSAARSGRHEKGVDITDDIH